MTYKFKDLLKENTFIILDGGLATELERRGCDLNHPLWSAKILQSAPEKIQAVHYDYFQAGADIAITTSYQASLTGFMQAGYSLEQAKQLLTLSFELAVKARDEFWQNNQDSKRSKPLIAASIGPYGAYLADGSEYSGNYNMDYKALLAFHEARIQYLIEAGANLFAIETIPNLLEAEVITDILSTYPDVEATLTFSAKDHLHISSGEEIRKCVQVFKEKEVIVAIGVNCANPKFITSLIHAIKSSSEKPIIVYPNNGDHYQAVSKSWLPHDDHKYFNPKAWLDAGASVIGGCCRTTPKDIESIKKLGDYL